MGHRVEPRHVASRVGDVRHSHADITAARADLGFDPAVSFRDGLARTVAWFMGERSEPVGRRASASEPQADGITGAQPPGDLDEAVFAGEGGTR